jgi:hypothetical protein
MMSEGPDETEAAALVEHLFGPSVNSDSRLLEMLYLTWGRSHEVFLRVFGSV